MTNVKMNSIYIYMKHMSEAASGASGACGHFVGNHAILSTFLVKYPVLLSEDGGRRVDNWELRFDTEDLR